MSRDPKKTELASTSARNEFDEPCLRVKRERKTPGTHEKRPKGKKGVKAGMEVRGKGGGEEDW